MSIKIYNVIGVGLIVGEKLGQDSDGDVVYLKYPGVVVPNQQTRDGIQTLMVPAVPEFFAGHQEMLKKFPLKKQHILYSGVPHSNILELYDNYTKKIIQAFTGIIKVGADAMNKLPKTGEGSPIIKWA